MLSNYIHDNGKVRLKLTGLIRNIVLTVGLLAGYGLAATSAVAQTGGEGGVQGTVTDATGAAVPNASVTAIAQSSRVATTRTTSSAGFYTISPLIPDTYTVTVTAKGFQISKQENLVITGLNVTGYNVSLTVGSTDQTVTVTEAPPALETTNATLGNVIDTRNYESLPLVMNGQQRDPTAFATLAPGAQGGARVPIFAGTGNYLGEVYLDGIPTTVSNMQGDNRVVSNSIPVESVDQMRVISSGPSAEYQGAGAMAFTTKSGGNQYHGQAVDLVRNTVFDTWGFTAPAATQPGPNGTVVPVGKPVEHQNELSLSVGGPIPLTRHKGFFFVNYDKFHGRNGVSPSQFTVPTTLMTQGNFSELLGKNAAGQAIGQIYDPLTTATCTAHNTGGAPCRYQYGYGPGTGIGANGNPVATGAPVNVIPANELSAISQYQQKFLPAPTSAAISNNYLAGGIATGYDNWEITAKVDYDLTASQRLSFFISHGVRQSVGFGAALPLPYTAAHNSSLEPTMIIMEHSIVLTPHLVNQVVYGFTTFHGPVQSPTEGISPYRGGPDVGIGNLPPGQASENFPSSTFSATTSFPATQSPWAGSGSNSYTTVPNAFTLVDNLQWTKGNHSMTFGFQTQWLQDNNSGNSGPSSIYTQTWSANSTAPFSGTSLSSTYSGYSYASFLLGAVNSAGTSIQAFDETGGRYHPWSPYFQDNWKLRPNLTLNLGLRWDYLPPYHEVLDRWSYLNPTAINSLTGTPGQLEFVGNRGADISCQCRTPVHTYFKNFGPRIGFAYSVNDKTVIRGGYALAYSRAGGVGGRGAVDAEGTGQTGFTANLILPAAVSSGVGSGPSFYLNTSPAFTAAGLANTNFGGPGFVLPPTVSPSAAALTNGIGNYVSNGKYVTPGGAPGYADPYLSGRAPEFSFFNIGFQRSLTNDLTITVNYAGSQSHFVAGAGVPGFWSGQIDPAHVAATGSVLASDNATNILNAPATAANIAIAQKADPSITVPYPGYAAAGAISTTPTIGRMLRPYPQYSSPPGPAWDNVANISYNSVQITLAQRTWKGLSYTLNYTYSKNLGDDGTVRSAFPVPAAASSNGAPIAGNNRADRGLTLTDTPQNLSIYGVDQLPFGQGHMGGNNFIVRNIVGGWALSGIFTYNSGTPLQIIGSGCTTPSSGTCMPDINPNFSGTLRRNGSWGKGITAAHLNAISYLNPAAFQLPSVFPLPANAAANAVATTKIGDAPRSGALNAWNPSSYNLNMAVQRSFRITPDRVKFIFRADCFNVSNKVTFGGIGATWSPASSTTFGQVTSASGNRDWQFSGRVTF
jgi:hypothetical protein